MSLRPLLASTQTTRRSNFCGHFSGGTHIQSPNNSGGPLGLRGVGRVLLVQGREGPGVLLADDLQVGRRLELGPERLARLAMVARRRRAPSLRTAGRQRISQRSAARSAIFRSSRPARSSRCQRVWVSTIQASADSRVYRSLAYQSQTRCRTTGLSASSRLPKGSSMIAPSAAWPAIDCPRRPSAGNRGGPGSPKGPSCGGLPSAATSRTRFSSGMMFGKIALVCLGSVMIRCTSRFMPTARSLVWLAGDQPQVGIPAQHEGREAAGNQLALAVLGRHEDHQPRALPPPRRSSFAASTAWCQLAR